MRSRIGMCGLMAVVLVAAVSISSPSTPRFAQPVGPGWSPKSSEGPEATARAASEWQSARAAIADPSRGYEAMLSAQQQAAGIPQATGAYGAGWRELGPKPLEYNDPSYNVQNPVENVSNYGWGSVSGRVTSIAVDQTDATGRVAWIGTGSGGVWVTRNTGATWTPVFDAQPTLAIGAVAIDPKNHNRVFVGTGESNFTTRSYNFPGTGVFRTTDGGKSWARTTRNVRANVIGHIEIAGGRVFVASDQGLWRSVDGGASYQNVKLPTNALGTAPASGIWANIVTDVRAKPGSPAEITAAVGCAFGTSCGPGNGLYRSTKGGAPGTWARLDIETLKTFSKTDDPIGRMSLAYSPHDPNVMWAVVQDAGLAKGGTNEVASKLNGIFRSGDDGATWQLKALSETLTLAPGRELPVGALVYGPGVQATYNQYVAVSPKDPDVVILGLEEVFQTRTNANGPGLAVWDAIGRYWNTCTLITSIDCSGAPSPSPQSGKTTHPDQHAGAFSPDGTRYYAGNDGGVYSQTADAGRFAIGGWSHVSRGVGTLQPFSAMMSGDGTVWLGLQDNGTGKIEPSGRGVATLGGDGAELVVSPTDSNRVIAEQTFGGLYKTTNGGVTWTFIQPGVTNGLVNQQVEIDPKDQNHIALGADQIVETTKGFDTICDATLPPVTSCDWMISYDLGVSESGVHYATSALDMQGAVVYAGICGECHIEATDPDHSEPKFNSGIVTNRRLGCTPVTGMDACWHRVRAKGLPNRFVTDVAIDPHNPSIVYATVGGYSQRWVRPTQKLPGIGRGHVFVSRDAGETFKDISLNLPDVPAESLEMLDSRLIVGTDTGVFTARTAGASWERLGRGLPNAPAVDVTLNPAHTKIVVGTYGRGVWTYDLTPVKTSRRMREYV